MVDKVPELREIRVGVRELRGNLTRYLRAVRGRPCSSRLATTSSPNYARRRPRTVPRERLAPSVGNSASPMISTFCLTTC